MNAQETSLGTVGIIKTIARNGLGRELTDAQALKASQDLKAAGLDTWAKVFHWLCSNNTALTVTVVELWC